MRGRGAVLTAGWLIAVLILLAAAGAALYLGLALTPICMCAPPPRGWHQVLSAGTIIKVVGPPLGVFLVAESIALSPTSRRSRVRASAFVVLITAITAAFSYATFMPCCGEWAPAG